MKDLYALFRQSLAGLRVLVAATLLLGFDILHDRSGSVERLYQTTGVPETFVIGRDGTIRKKVLGAANWSSDANRALVRSLLEQDADPSPLRGFGFCGLGLRA